jgi:zinc transport system substrate-binding protein
MRPFAAALATVLVLAACGSGSGEPDGQGSDAGAGHDLQIVATVFPLAWMAEQIAPDAGLVFLGARGQDPHDLELSPGDRDALETADLVLYMGDIGFQPQVERALTSRTGATVSVADVVGEAALRTREDDHDEDDDDHDDEGDDDHDDDTIDPHVWFDATAMAQVAEAIGAAVADLDADHGGTYTTAAAAVRDTLRDLDAEIDALLSGCTLDTAIVSHEAYAYLLEPRGLEQEGISGAGGHSEASPRRLAELTERIREQGIPAVLAEPFEGRSDAEALAAEAGVPMLEIDPLEVVTDEQATAGYPGLLRQQAEAFAAALECAGS